MGTIAEALTLRELVDRQREEYQAAGYEEGEFLGFLPMAKIAEFKGPGGLVETVAVPDGFGNLNGVLQARCFVMFSGHGADAGSKTVKEIIFDGYRGLGW